MFTEEEGVGCYVVLGVGLAFVVQIKSSPLEVFSGLAVGGAKAAGDE